MIPLYPVKTRYKLATPYSLLSTGKTREMGTKGVPAEIQKPEVVTPKRADNHSGLINKFVLPLEIIIIIAVVTVVTILVNRTMPSDLPLLKINN